MAEKKFYAMHDGDYEYMVACESPADWENSPRIGYVFETEAARDEFVARRNDAARAEYSGVSSHATDAGAWCACFPPLAGLDSMGRCEFCGCQRR